MKILLGVDINLGKAPPVFVICFTDVTKPTKWKEMERSNLKIGTSICGFSLTTVLGKYEAMVRILVSENILSLYFALYFEFSMKENAIILVEVSNNALCIDVIMKSR